MPGCAAGQQAGTDRAEAVDVLGRIDRRDHRIGIDMVRKRELDQDPVDPVVGSELGDQGQQLVLRSVARQPVVDRLHAGLFAGAVLVGDVDLGGRVVADDHRRQDRHPAARFDERRDLGGDPRPDQSGDLLAVDDFC